MTGLVFIENKFTVNIAWKEVRMEEEPRNTLQKEGFICSGCSVKRGQIIARFAVFCSGFLEVYRILGRSRDCETSKGND